MLYSTQRNGIINVERVKDNTMRETGKNKKIKGYKEIITKGYHKYKLPVTNINGKTDMVEFVATLREMVPEHKPCEVCGKYIGKYEEQMASTMISCEHKHLNEQLINKKIMKFECDDCKGTWSPHKDLLYWTPKGTQEYFCFECFGEML
jgi:hypothetical protein